MAFQDIIVEDAVIVLKRFDNGFEVLAKFFSALEQIVFLQVKRRDSVLVRSICHSGKPLLEYVYIVEGKCLLFQVAVKFVEVMFFDHGHSKIEIGPPAVLIKPSIFRFEQIVEKAARLMQMAAAPCIHKDLPQYKDWKVRKSACLKHFFPLLSRYHLC